MPRQFLDHDRRGDTWREGPELPPSARVSKMPNGDTIKREDVYQAVR